MDYPLNDFHSFLFIYFFVTTPLVLHLQLQSLQLQSPFNYNPYNIIHYYPLFITIPFQLNYYPLFDQYPLFITIPFSLNYYPLFIKIPIIFIKIPIIFITNPIIFITIPIMFITIPIMFITIPFYILQNILHHYYILQHYYISFYYFLPFSLIHININLYNSRLKDILLFLMNKISGAKRLTGFDMPTVWSVMTPLAVKTNSVNLGQGFPAWSPPDFYLQNLEESTKNANHQYTRSFGSLPLVQSIANYHKKRFPDLDPENNIVTTNGGVQALYCSIMALVNEGDEVAFFDPSYDCYRAQIQMAGGISKGIPLKPKIDQTKDMVRKRCGQKYQAGPDDDWEIDFDNLQKSISEKTKVFILNTPHNPVGKVFTEQEIAKLAEFFQKYPQIVILQDNVYEGMTFDDYYGKDLPKLSFQKGMEDRSLSVYSGGKIFAATGVRSGWVIGSKSLIKSVRSVHQYNVFCAYNITENTIAKSLDVISRPQDTYMKDYAQKLTRNRNILLDELLASKFDFNLWIPKGGYFIMADISKAEVKEKYLKDEQGKTRTKDYAFCIQLAYEQGVVAIPCSPFYSKEDSYLGEKYVRFAFCKPEEMIRQAGKRMR